MIRRRRAAELLSIDEISPTLACDLNCFTYDTVRLIMLNQGNKSHVLSEQKKFTTSNGASRRASGRREAKK